MSALRRTLVRIQATLPTKLLSVKACLCTHDTQAHSCPAVVPSFMVAQGVEHFVMQPASAHHGSPCDYYCGLPAKLPFSHIHSQVCAHSVKFSKCKQHAQSSHVRTYASEGTSDASESIQGLANLSDALDLQSLKPSGLSQPDAGTPDAVRHADSKDGGQCFEAVCTFQAPQTRAQSRRVESLQLLCEKVALLECEQVSPADATILRKSKALNSTSLERLVAVLKLLKVFLGSGERACQAVAICPGILLQQSELLGQKLTVLAYFGIREEVIRKVCTTTGVLSRKLQSLHKILIVLEEIGLSVKARNMLFWSHPNIVNARGVPMLHASDFFESLGMSEKEISRSLERHPTLLLCSVGNLIERYIYFQQLGFPVNEFVKATCAGLPSLTVQKLQSKIKFLKDQSFSDADVRVLVSRAPAILRRGCNSLKSKLNFLLGEQKYEIADIVRYPHCLSLSLQDRLIPRLKAVKEKGLFKVYALSTILSHKDLVFQELISRAEKKKRCVFQQSVCTQSSKLPLELRGGIQFQNNLSVTHEVRGKAV